MPPRTLFGEAHLGKLGFSSQVCCRANRFGLQLNSNNEPALAPSSEARTKDQIGHTQKAGAEFRAGIDLLDEVLKGCATLRSSAWQAGFQLTAVSAWQAEVERRKSRAARFQTEGQGLSYGSTPEVVAEDAALEEQKRLRAQRFGTEYRAPDRTGQAQAGKTGLPVPPTDQGRLSLC